MRRKAIMQSCDNPDCDNEYEYVKGEDLPLGYYIERGAWHDGGGGGPIPVTYACSIECLTAAIEARIHEEW